MVHQLLLTTGELEGCRLNGCNPITSELRTIEEDSLGEIRTHLGDAGDKLAPIRRPLPTYGTPVWFDWQHAKRVLAEMKAEEGGLLSQLPQPGGVMKAIVIVLVAIAAVAWFTGWGYAIWLVKAAASTTTPPRAQRGAASPGEARRPRSRATPGSTPLTRRCSPRARPSRGSWLPCCDG